MVQTIQKSLVLDKQNPSNRMSSQDDPPISLKGIQARLLGSNAPALLLRGKAAKSSSSSSNSRVLGEEEEQEERSEDSKPRRAPAVRSHPGASIQVPSVAEYTTLVMATQSLLLTQLKQPPPYVPPNSYLLYNTIFIQRLHFEIGGWTLKKCQKEYELHYYFG